MALLRGATVAEIRRHGKQLAIVAVDGRVLVVQLGMTGQFFFVPRGSAMRPRDHVHARWMVAGRDGDDGVMLFRDPRRFGGLTTLASVGALQRHWATLGPDALTITADALAVGLAGSRRAVKAALLDQRVLAGVGNIYADEALFGARIHPLRPAGGMRADEVRALAEAVRRVLRRAIKAGGSTLNDYRDANGAEGKFSSRHAVYGRAGTPCVACGSLLRRQVVAQRTTVYCPVCQPERPGAGRARPPVFCT